MITASRDENTRLTVFVLNAASTFGRFWKGDSYSITNIGENVLTLRRFYNLNVTFHTVSRHETRRDTRVTV